MGFERLNYTLLEGFCCFVTGIDPKPIPVNLNL